MSLSEAPKVTMSSQSLLLFKIRIILDNLTRQCEVVSPAKFSEGHKGRKLKSTVGNIQLVNTAAVQLQQSLRQAPVN